MAFKKERPDKTKPKYNFCPKPSERNNEMLNLMALNLELSSRNQLRMNQVDVELASMFLRVIETWWLSRPPGTQTLSIQVYK